MKSFLYLFTTLLIAGLAFTSTSCQKETDCKATIKCVDSSGIAVSDATVLLYAQVKDPNDPKGTTSYTADVKATGTTDESGQVNFVFKLPAIFDVKATKVVGIKTLSGTSIIKLEEGNSVEKTVTLR